MKLLGLLPFLLPLTQAVDFNRAACQSPDQKNGLVGCPKNTVLVGTDKKFATIQSAISSIPNTTDTYTILIEPGNYTEQLNVTRRGPLYLLGMTKSPNTNVDNLVKVFWSNATGTNTTGSYDNAYTSVLTVAPNLNASLTGSGPTGFAVPAGTPFGNEDFRAYNIDFENVYLPYSAGPSLAVSISYANAGFYFCSLRSYQDTVRRAYFQSPNPSIY
jgi:hypothetical protein